MALASATFRSGRYGGMCAQSSLAFSLEEAPTFGRGSSPQALDNVVDSAKSASSKGRKSWIIGPKPTSTQEVVQFTGTKTPQIVGIVFLINPFEIVYARFRILQFEKFLINRELIFGLRRVEQLRENTVWARQAQILTPNGIIG